MKHKAKAKKLIKKFETAIVEELLGGDKIFKYTAKQCALICADEMIEYCVELDDHFGISDWQEIKKEIKI